MKTFRIFIFILLVSGIFSCSTCCFNERAFIEKYFLEIYQPSQLDSVYKSLPSECFIENITWYCYQKNHLCQSSTLQMVAERNGITDKPLDFYSFLIGYTYGATYVKGAGMFAPYSDPEPGFILAGKFLGIERKYQITDNKDLLVENIKYFLSKDIPVRIAWNSAMTMKYAIESEYFPRPKEWKEPPKEAFSPHSVLFVGYDSSSFYYYETHGKDFTLRGEKGIRIDKSSAIDAISSFSRNYRLPWKYMMTIFVKDSISNDLNKIFERNGEEMIGRVLGPTATGSFAIKGLSQGVKKEGSSIFNSPKKEYFKRTIEILMEIRLDNSVYLEQEFSTNNEIQKVSELLKKSSNNYGRIITILEKEKNNKDDVISIFRLLELSAELEKEAGKIFILASNLGIE